MAGTIHKITAGCGYEYLTRQVAAMDATDRGRVTLADYYSAKGEAPGRWTGAGLASLIHPTAEVPASAEREVHAGSVVSAEQMRALFGEGRHPNADEIEAQVAAAGGAAEDQLRASALGARWSETTAHPEFRVRLAEMFVAHNLGSGQRWSAPIADDVKAQMRTELGLEMFRDEYRRDPRDDRELSGWIARINRPLPQGVAGYDLTFSPVKSVSTLWALGHTSTRRVVVDGKEMDLSQAIEACHDKAVADAIAFVEDQATFSRLGTDGVQQVDTEGLIAAAFTHRDSRAGDPDLHTHVAVSNKVRVRVPGTDEYRWVALDGTPLFKAIVSSSEVYNSRIEAYVRQYIGAQFAERPSLDKSRRPIREIVGVPEELMSRWSQRREAIEIRQSELAAQFQAVHGREPTSGELFDLAQQATLETREAKHEPRSLNEQRDTWWTQAVDELGSSSNVNAALESVFTGEQAAIRTGPIQSEEATAIADHVVSVVSESRARWQRPHLRAEAERQLRQGRGCAAYTAYGSDTALPWAGWVSPEHWSESVEAIVRAAESASRTQAPEVTDSDQGEPQMLRRLDGASVYSTHDTAMWTSAEILAAERRIVAAARRTDGRVVDGIHVDLALLEEAANGRSLNAGQTALVRELAGSGRRVQLALAPAGTGKTTAMRAFGRAWTDSGGAVIGLAPTAAAAAVLREDLGAETDTLAKLVHIVRARADYEQAVLAAERGDLNARRALAAGDVRDPQRPPWFDRIGPSTVLVVDEAGMAATADLDALIGFAQSRGAAVRLVGDDQQLASISAGGVLRDVAHEVDALTLSEVVRFSDTAEGSASLALREGDVAGLGYLADHGRIHVASDRAAADQAFGAWLDDQSAGDDSVMLAATRDTTNDLNAAARAHRLDGLSAAEVGREIQLADGLSASVGDTICTRRNNRALRTSATDWVRNGDRWEITAIGQDGTVTARHRDRGRTIDLPAKYVAQHVTLGYASTIHAAQGLTADRCHVVGNDSLSRQLFYVAMTRGRHGNHVYLSTAEGDPHKVLTPKALTPDTAVELLSKVLDRDEAQRSATTGARQARDPATRLGPAAAAFIDAAGTLAEAAVGAERLAELADHTRQIDPRIVETSAWPVLRKHLATLELSPSGDATAALAAAYHSREIDSAADVAALLDWRLDPTSGHSAQQGPLPWLGSVPEHLPAEHVEYLHRRAQLVTSLADELREASGHWSTSTAPLWARPYVAAGADSALLGDLAVFRAAHGVSDSDSRPTGPAQPRTRTRKWQDALDERAAALVAVSA
ncbi:MAG: MobF family relaxase, partial [Gordonia sp. (in: high G+C Gram-positive bacteria)]|uniref:MobF family relaxase n=1 Tax=Gordonia sp. (in: high G+C Gram-positive bacteria) TaxID=84139 RepID=UPI003BB5DA86